MTPIETNKPLFFDTDGSPLEGGLIYIGQPSTDPRTNPKTVTFRDSGGSEFTASQPLKTKAGRIVYNGLPIVALVDGEYSMLIINANGQQVDYSRSVNAEGTSGGGIADFSEVTRVGLTLSEIKGFDAAVGETLKNVGRLTATDQEGGVWLVQSASGTPGDDVFVIDLTNGLQAIRIDKVNSYPKLVWSGSSTTVSMDALDDGGPGVYMVGVSGVFGTLVLTSETTNMARGLLDLDFGGTFFTVEAVRYSGTTRNFTAISQSITDLSGTPTAGQTNLTITQIYKV